jgi:hypothetical protein
MSERSNGSCQGQERPVRTSLYPSGSAIVTPPYPSRDCGGDPGAAGIDQAADNARIDLAIEVKHQQIFLGRRGWRFTARIADELEMPCGIWPSDHQQRMSAFCGGVGPEQNVEAQAVDPEPFGRL